MSALVGGIFRFRTDPEDRDFRGSDPGDPSPGDPRDTHVGAAIATETHSESLPVPVESHSNLNAPESTDPAPGQFGTRLLRISELLPEANKEQITLRLDADVVQFFRSTGKRYQSRINAALREYMRANKAGW
jgi:uncharacterized protein (DUF4415 family)